MLQHYPSPQGNGTVLLCQSVQQLRRLLPAYYWLGCFLFNFKIFRSKTTEKNLALSPLTRFLQVCDHWLFNSTTFLQLLPKTRLMNRCGVHLRLGLLRHRHTSSRRSCQPRDPEPDHATHCRRRRLLRRTGSCAGGA